MGGDIPLVMSFEREFGDYTAFVSSSLGSQETAKIWFVLYLESTERTRVVRLAGGWKA